jgi:hypothetical protein
VTVAPVSPRRAGEYTGTKQRIAAWVTRAIARSTPRSYELGHDLKHARVREGYIR